MAALKTPFDSASLDPATAPTSRRPPLPGYWLRIAIVVVAISVGTAGLRFVISGGSLLDSLAYALVYSSCIAVLAGAIVPPVRHRTRAMGPIVEWIATLAGLAVVAVSGTLLACLLLGALGYGGGQPLAHRFAASFEMNAVITAVIGVAVTLYESQRARLDALALELRTQELARERDRKEALEARLASLESRLHPHFLFNTLNAISALIHDDPDRAERTVERLATLLRAALDATGQTTVPLAQELAIVADYLEIEKTRFGARLSYTIDAAGDAPRCELPPLSVQTLVENSVKHAIAPRPSGGRVCVEASAQDDRLVVTVGDDGPGFALPDAKPGHGLENLQSRLVTLFGDACALDVTHDREGTRVTMSLPRRTSTR